LYLQSGYLDHAGWVLSLGKAVAPNAPGIHANIGALLFHKSRQSDGDLQDRVHDAIRAAAAWFEADRIEGGVEVYRAHAAEALDHAAAIGTMPAVPNLEGLDDAERGLSLPGNAFVGYSGEAACEQLMVVGRNLMNRGRYAVAVGPLSRIVSDGTSSLVGIAALYLGVTHILLGDGGAAEAPLMRAEEVGDSIVRAYSRFNRLRVARHKAAAPP